MNTTLNHYLNHALVYAQRGWRVFPLHAISDGACTCGRDNCSSAGKHPRTKNGVHDATTHAATIQRWWSTWPEANIGIATGEGLHVIDVDTAKGASLDSLDGLGLDDLPNRFTVRTGSGGYHLYLRCEQALPNTANKLGPFIDTRGEGSYVVAPPSFNLRGQYTWLTPLQELPMPPQLLAKLQGARIHYLHPSYALNSLQEQEKISNEPLPHGV